MEPARTFSDRPRGTAFWSHVYSDATWLHGERLREELAVTRPPGARFASVDFVTGKLDPVATRTEFLDLARRSFHQRYSLIPALSRRSCRPNGPFAELVRLTDEYRDEMREKYGRHVLGE